MGVQACVRVRGCVCVCVHCKVSRLPLSDRDLVAAPVVHSVSSVTEPNRGLAGFARTIKNARRSGPQSNLLSLHSSDVTDDKELYKATRSKSNLLLCCPLSSIQCAVAV